MIANEKRDADTREMMDFINYNSELVFRKKMIRMQKQKEAAEAQRRREKAQEKKETAADIRAFIIFTALIIIFEIFYCMRADAMVRAYFGG